MGAKVGVLVVEDSFLMRRIISDIINSDEELEVIGRARDGREGLEKAKLLDPQIITLDINLPGGRDGISVLEEIMKIKPTKVIMLSAYTRQGAAATMRALERGAVDFVAKPSGEISLGLEKLRNEIVSKIKLASRVDLVRYLASLQRQGVRPAKEAVPGIRKAVVIGASTGGPKAVLDVMLALPPQLAAPFFIVQHMPKGFTLSFAERISWQSGIKAKEAEERDMILPGRAFVAPAGSHMVLEQVDDEIRVRLTMDPPVNFVRPAIDVTMQSVARIFGKDTIAVILTGMGKDGLEGCRAVKEHGGTVIVQDEESSVVWGMPKAVVKAELADRVLPIEKIANAILEFMEA